MSISDEWSEDAKALQACSIKLSSYKSFKGIPEGLETIKPINIIVGRNNSGKSALLEGILMALGPKERMEQFSGRVVLTTSISQVDIDSLPDRTTFAEAGKSRLEYTPRRYGRQNLVGKQITFEIARGKIEFLNFGLSQNDPAHVSALTDIGRRLNEKITSILDPWIVFSVHSDRDVVPEQEANILFKANGAGLTSFLQSLMFRAAENHLNIIEDELVPSLNQIMEPDNSYGRIIMRASDKFWEVYLDEKGKGIIPLSGTGSGLKTILLVLANMILIPHVFTTTSRNNFVYSFEELENNLHPATLRRLFYFIRAYCQKFKTHFFITTHSHIVIDLFKGDDLAQILHVTHDGTVSKVKTVATYRNGCDVLDDLDIRVSDLLQTNVVVWVEGPTDAIYFERWIDLHSSYTLRRGIDYQCVLYGGSVGSHLSFDIDIADKLVEATKICRHSIFLADSNRSQQRSILNEQVKRVFTEIKEVGGLGWITEGREVENYLPVELVSLEAKARLDESTMTIYTDIYQAIKTARGNATEMSKMILAKRIVPKLTEENMYRDDLKDRLTEVCKFVCLWNGKPDMIQKEPAISGGTSTATFES